MKKHEALILEGIGASPGIASGKVKIISSYGEAIGFRKGDVLVAKITDPSMVMAMSNSAAIICDIGGIGSHPAIVSREMGTPCVVNTKKATKILKNGDEVKVDGKTGKIYLLS